MGNRSCSGLCYGDEICKAKSDDKVLKTAAIWAKATSMDDEESYREEHRYYVRHLLEKTPNVRRPSSDTRTPNQASNTNRVSATSSPANSTDRGSCRSMASSDTLDRESRLERTTSRRMSACEREEVQDEVSAARS
jgi:hypothetical protein